MTITIDYRFVVKRDVAANFTAADTLLLQGEWALETDTLRMKIGDGATPWATLGYFMASPAVMSAALDTAFGNARGSILYRDSAQWKVLAPGTANYLLQTNGAGANPSWVPPSGGAAFLGYTALDPVPASPTPYDDEFQSGSGIDTTGARRAGANAWNLWTPSGGVVPAISGGDFLKIDGTGGTAQIFVAAQPVPVSGAWEFTAKCIGASLGSQFGPCLGILNRSISTNNWESLFTFSGAVIEETTSFDASTNVFTFVSNNNSGSLPNTPWYYLRVSYPGSGTTYTFSYDTLASASAFNAQVPPFTNFATLTTRALAGVTHIALSTVSSIGVSYVDWFRRTA